MTGDAPEKTKTMKPRLLKGFRDILPEQSIARHKVVATLQQVFERYGFAPLETPALEPAEFLLGELGTEGNKELFLFNDPDGVDVALRYDLTVSLARVVASYQDLPTPFRRYQMGNCWRWDKPGPGRFREFLQFDVDTVGTEEISADAEIVAVMCAGLEALGVTEYVARYSSRKLLNLLVRFAGLPGERAHDLFRVLDKLDKFGLEEILKELTTGRVDVSGDRIPGLGLETEQVERIRRFLLIKEESCEKTLDAVADLLKDDPAIEPCVGELKRLMTSLRSLGLPADKMAFDPTLARGLDYYTGLIFEAILPCAPKYGTVFGGGRYDDLVMRFSGRKVPATGASIGVDRILSVLVEQGKLKLRKSTSDVLVCVLDRNRFEQYQEMTLELRRAGVNTELFLGKAKGLGRQLKHADRSGITFAVIAGEDEFGKDEVSVKNLQEGMKHSEDASERSAWLDGRFGQITVPRARLVSTVIDGLDALRRAAPDSGAR